MSVGKCFTLTVKPPRIAGGWLLVQITVYLLTGAVAAGKLTLFIMDAWERLL